ncbi:anti-sigma factor [Fulvivirga kasyanovii]|uniref:Regulator of SigK n=1 Tax=Fulvivirga kasyanovii TaxID=396812 RepID=A0ABW9RW34_9BACT|nr:anti-sigma factor [Fulvivirga kasyanovii]
MNIQEYISSGILEAYVLGELPREEALEVEKMALEHHEVREEITRIEITLESVAFETAVKPAADLKDKIMQQVDSSQQQAGANVVSMPISNKPNYWKYAMAASVSIALVTTILAFNFWSKWKSTEVELNNLIAQNERIARDYNTVNNKLEDIEHEFSILSDASYRKVVLQGTENAPQALANIYWNPASEEVYLNIQNLKELTQEQQYQLWAIIDGTPVDAGVFDSGQSGLLKMKNIARASAFAVTVEPRGGSENPTLDTMQVMGAVGES